MPVFAVVQGVQKSDGGNNVLEGDTRNPTTLITKMY